MKTKIITLVLLSLAVLAGALSVQVKAPPPASGLKPVAPAIPPLPAGVTELKFGDFFAYPVGPRGLELTAKLRELDGRRVRILGYMVRQESPAPGRFLLSPFPAHQALDSCLVDDVPPCKLEVSVAGTTDERCPFTPKLLVLTGTLSIGNRTEADGHISMLRLALDPPQPAARSRVFASDKGAARLSTAAEPRGRNAH